MLAALTIARRYWWAPIIAALFVAILIQRGTIARKQVQIAALNLTIANVRTVQAQQAATNLAHVRQVETAQAAITKDQTDALSQQLADARANLARYVSLHAAPPTHSGTAGTDRVPGTSDAASAVTGSDPQALVPVADLDACTQAWVTATGWQAFWGKEGAVPR